MRIALIAHDSRKELMTQFCTAYIRVLSQNELVATGVTGKVDTNILYTEFWNEQEDEEVMKTYTHTDQMPDWAQNTFRRLIDAKIVKVDDKGEIAVQECSVQPMVYLDRLCGGQIEKLPDAIKALQASK